MDFCKLKLEKPACCPNCGFDLRPDNPVPPQAPPKDTIEGLFNFPVNVVPPGPSEADKTSKAKDKLAPSKSPPVKLNLVGSQGRAKDAVSEKIQTHLLAVPTGTSVVSVKATINTQPGPLNKPWRSYGKRQADKPAQDLETPSASKLLKLVSTIPPAITITAISGKPKPETTGQNDRALPDLVSNPVTKPGQISKPSNVDVQQNNNYEIRVVPASQFKLIEKLVAKPLGIKPNEIRVVSPSQLPAKSSPQQVKAASAAKPDIYQVELLQSPSPAATNPSNPPSNNYQLRLTPPAKQFPKNSLVTREKLQMIGAATAGYLMQQGSPQPATKTMIRLKTASSGIIGPITFTPFAPGGSGTGQTEP